MDSPTWIDALNPREKMEVLFALEYFRQFNHGTSGHLGYVVIAKLCEIANVLWDNRDNSVDVELLRIRLTSMLQAPSVPSEKPPVP